MKFPNVRVRKGLRERTKKERKDKANHNYFITALSLTWRRFLDNFAWFAQLPSVQDTHSEHIHLGPIECAIEDYGALER